MAWVKGSAVGVGEVEGPMGCVRGRGRPLWCRIWLGQSGVMMSSAERGRGGEVVRGRLSAQCRPRCVQVVCGLLTQGACSCLVLLCSSVSLLTSETGKQGDVPRGDWTAVGVMRQPSFPRSHGRQRVTWARSGVLLLSAWLVGTQAILSDFACSKVGETVLQRGAHAQEKGTHPSRHMAPSNPKPLTLPQTHQNHLLYHLDS